MNSFNLKKYSHVNPTSRPSIFQNFTLDPIKRHVIPHCCKYLECNIRDNSNIHDQIQNQIEQNQLVHIGFLCRGTLGLWVQHNHTVEEQIHNHIVVEHVWKLHVVGDWNSKPSYIATRIWWRRYLGDRFSHAEIERSQFGHNTLDVTPAHVYKQRTLLLIGRVPPWFSKWVIRNSSWKRSTFWTTGFRVL